MAEKAKPSNAPAARVPNGHSYCWTEHPDGGRRCTLPQGHAGQHLHQYTRTTW
ncbi:hypothetical protein [Streptomyces sp. NPDC088812]|uniref:hypothetical protein n=1 Tax=Streptomyces sp. NPDC088812 TaxID=3365905 RepID=UPI003800E410